MITGKQIREARRLLGWHRTKLALSAKLPHSTIERAELTDGEPAITVASADAIRQTLEAAGIELTQGAMPGVRLRARPD